MSQDKFYEVICELRNRDEASPCSIARNINSDFRTVKDILKKGEALKILKCEDNIIAGRKYSACSLTPEYKKLFKKMRR